MADLKDSGLRYCIAHEGVVDVDQETCDFHRFDSHDFDAVTECVTRPLLFDASDIGGGQTDA